jgi:hypothetical protein
MNPDRWLGAPNGPLTFRGMLERPDGTRESLLEQTIDPRSDVAARRWLPVSLDLSRHAGDSVSLILSIEATGEATGIARGTRRPRRLGRSGIRPTG